MNRRIQVLIASIIILFSLIGSIASLGKDNTICKMESMPLQTPSRQLLLGTDLLGRSLVCIIIYGSKQIVFTSASAFIVSMILGVLLSLLLYNKYFEKSMYSLSEIIAGLPDVPILAIFYHIIGGGPIRLGALISLFYTPFLLRTINSVVKDIMNTAYYESTVALGGSRLYSIYVNGKERLFKTVFVLSSITASRATFTISGLCLIGLCDATDIGWANTVSLTLSRPELTASFQASLTIVLPILLITIYSYSLYVLGKTIIEKNEKEASFSLA